MTTTSDLTSVAETEVKADGKKIMKQRPSVMENWESSEPVDIFEDTPLSGAQFTSFADVLLTTCASPPSIAAPSFGGGAWGSGGGGSVNRSRVGSSTSAWSGGGESGSSSQLTYAQRMEAMEKESDEREALLFAVEAAGEGCELLPPLSGGLGAPTSHLAPPTHNDAFSMAFQQALFKQAGKDKSKKKRRGSNVNSTN